MDMLWRNKYCKLYMDVAHIVIMCNRQHMSRLNSGKVLVQTWGKMTYKVLGLIRLVAILYPMAILFFFLIEVT